MLLETHEGKRRGNHSLSELSANLAGLQEAFPQINLKECVCEKERERENAHSFFSVVQDH